MDQILGNDPLTYALLLLLAFAPAALATGRAVASVWAPAMHVVVYCVLLCATHRFFDYALFVGDFAAPGGASVSLAVLLAVGLGAWRMRRAEMMTAQYPWLYERVGPFGWRARAGDVSLASPGESA
jgi:hypothetical protein